MPLSRLMLLVSLRARPGRELELAQTAHEFVTATRELPGALGSTLYRSADDPLTFTLVERFSGREALDQHMAADYFTRFQLAQGPLLQRPVEAIFHQRAKG